MNKSAYQTYLTSREWAVLREAVKERAGGMCERCRRNPIDAVHHLTYERKGNELLSDLQGICTPCHEFTHAKSWRDPCYYYYNLCPVDADELPALSLVETIKGCKYLDGLAKDIEPLLDGWIADQLAQIQSKHEPFVTGGFRVGMQINRVEKVEGEDYLRQHTHSYYFAKIVCHVDHHCCEMYIVSDSDLGEGWNTEDE